MGISSCGSPPAGLLLLLEFSCWVSPPPGESLLATNSHGQPPQNQLLPEASSPPSRMPSPTSASLWQRRGRRRLAAASEGVALFHLSCSGGQILPVSRNPTAVGRGPRPEQPPPGSCSCFCLGSQGKQQELFQASQLRRKSSPIRSLQSRGRQPGACCPLLGASRDLLCPLCPPPE